MSHRIGTTHVPAINSVEISRSRDTSEVNLIDKDQNLLLRGGEAHEEWTIEFTLFQVSYADKRKVEKQRNELKRLVSNDRKYNGFKFQDDEGFLVVKNIDVSESGETSTIREGTIEAIFLPWPKYLSDQDPSDFWAGAATTDVASDAVASASNVFFALDGGVSSITADANVFSAESLGISELSQITALGSISSTESLGIGQSNFITAQGSIFSTESLGIEQTNPVSALGDVVTAESLGIIENNSVVSDVLASASNDTYALTDTASVTANALASAKSSSLNVAQSNVITADTLVATNNGTLALTDTAAVTANAIASSSNVDVAGAENPSQAQMMARVGHSAGIISSETGVTLARAQQLVNTVGN